MVSPTLQLVFKVLCMKEKRQYKSIRHKKTIFGNATYEVVNVIRKILFSLVPLFLLLNLFLVSAQSIMNIEILDIEKEEIITIPTNTEIQLEAKKIIKEIDGVVKQFNPIPDKGYMVKIPLTPSIQLANKWLNALIVEAIIIIPEDEKPYLLLFDDENKPYFFTFNTEIDTLLKTLDFPIKKRPSIGLLMGSTFVIP